MGYRRSGQIHNSSESFLSVTNDSVAGHVLIGVFRAI